MCENNILI